MSRARRLRPGLVHRAGPDVRAPHAERPLGQGRAARGAARAARRRGDRRDAVDAHVRARADRTARPPRLPGRPAPHAARRGRRRHAPSLLFVLVFAGLADFGRRSPSSAWPTGSSPGTCTSACAPATRSSRPSPSGQFTLATEPGTRRARSCSSPAASASRRSSASPRRCCARSRRAASMLLCGNRSEDEIIFRERLGALAAEFAPRLVVRHALDAARELERRRAARSTERATLRLLGTTDADAFYVCGPEADDAERVRAHSPRAGVPRDRVHTERFAYASADHDPHPRPLRRDHVRRQRPPRHGAAPARRSCRPGSRPASTCPRAAPWAAAAPARSARRAARS